MFYSFKWFSFLLWRFAHLFRKHKRLWRVSSNIFPQPLCDLPLCSVKEPGPPVPRDGSQEHRHAGVTARETSPHINKTLSPETQMLVPARMMPERCALPRAILPHKHTSLFALCLIRNPPSPKIPTHPTFNTHWTFGYSTNKMDRSIPHFPTCCPSAENAFLLFLVSTSSSSKTHLTHHSSGKPFSKPSGQVNYSPL